MDNCKENNHKNITTILLLSVLKVTRTIILESTYSSSSDLAACSLNVFLAFAMSLLLFAKKSSTWSIGIQVTDILRLSNSFFKASVKYDSHPNDDTIASCSSHNSFVAFAPVYRARMSVFRAVCSPPMNSTTSTLYPSIRSTKARHASVTLSIVLSYNMPCLAIDVIGANKTDDDDDDDDVTLFFMRTCKS